MKIAIVHQPINTISPINRNGSVEIITYEMARGLARHCDVVVYAKKGPNQKEFEYNQGVRYQRISTVFDEWHNYLQYGVDKLEKLFGVNTVSQSIRRTLLFRNAKRPLFSSRWYYRNYALQVARHLRKENCDIVHIHTFSQFVPVIRAFNPKIKIVLHMHCEWLTQLDYELIENRLRYADLIIGVSGYITEKIRRRFPQFAKRCQTVYNAVDIEAFAKEKRQNVADKNGTKHLLFVGRVSPEKGVHVLLEAFHKVLRQYPCVQLKIAGYQGSLAFEKLSALSNDPKEMDLKRFYGSNYISYLKNQLSLSEMGHVSFLGAIPHRLLPKLYRNADVCVVPSVCNEPGAMPVVEAMVAGVPVVATRGGGVPEIVVDGKTGLLVERGDPSALAKAILLLLTDERLRESIANASREQAIESFSWDKTIEKLFRLYKTPCSAEG
jgi:glycosyltransferase involved in cell wall biosynthesis